MLWMRAGSLGRRIDKRADTFTLADAYGVLFNPDHWRPFADAVAGRPDLRCAFIVTDSDQTYQAVVGELPARIEPVRLYESYLRTFEINRGED